MRQRARDFAVTRASWQTRSRNLIGSWACSARRRTWLKAEPVKSKTTAIFSPRGMMTNSRHSAQSEALSNLSIRVVPHSTTTPSRGLLPVSAFRGRRLPRYALLRTSAGGRSPNRKSTRGQARWHRHCSRPRPSPCIPCERGHRNFAREAPSEHPFDTRLPRSQCE